MIQEEQHAIAEMLVMQWQLLEQYTCKLCHFTLAPGWLT